MSAQEIADEATALPVLERAKLAQTLLRSLDPAPEPGVEEAWDAEVARRLQRLRARSAEGRPAADVFRDIQALHQT